MSFQAVTWAIEQKAGSPSAKATLWSIANYANETWCAWPSQKTICDESEQSPDAIQKRLPELEDRDLIRRIPLRFSGRKTVDFFILRPSRFFRSPLSEIEPLLPRGCSIDPKFVAADHGNAEPPEAPDPSPDSNPSATADHGNEKTAISAPALPLTLPQIAADVAALERQQEPESEPKNQEIDRCAREPLISKDAQQLADDCVVALGFETHHPPIELAGLPYQTSIMLARGYDPPSIVAAFGRFAGKPLKPLNYYVKVVETACTEAKNETTRIGHRQPGGRLPRPGSREDTREQLVHHLAGLRKRVRDRKESEAQADERARCGGIGGPAPAQLPKPECA